MTHTLPTVPAPSTAGHTEMPWTARHRTDHECGNYDLWEIHWSEHGECVAEVVHEKADALLIAAAPHLAACCEAMLALLMGGTLVNGSASIVTEQRVKIAAMRALLSAGIDFGPNRDPFGALGALAAAARSDAERRA